MIGNALQVPNTGSLDDNKLYLGHHDNDCLGNVTHCPDGLTISFWIYMFQQSYQWPYSLRGTFFEFSAYTPATNPFHAASVYNGTHRWGLGGDRIIYDYWHHYAFVYTAEGGFVIYTDGYRRDQDGPHSEVRPSIEYEMGCIGSQNCAKAKYDDLRVWNEAKDEDFIWHLWQAL